MIINLTPHPLAIHTPAGIIDVPPSGAVARCAEVRTDRPPIDGIPVPAASYGAVIGLPGPVPDTIYVASALVLAAVPDRADVFAPGPAVRDGEGKVVGCRGLTCTPAY